MSISPLSLQFTPDVIIALKDNLKCLQEEADKLSSIIEVYKSSIDITLRFNRIDRLDFTWYTLCDDKDERTKLKQVNSRIISVLKEAKIIDLLWLIEVFKKLIILFIY